MVINTAFFEKEAKELWTSFQNKKNLSYDLSPNLMSFLDRLNKNHGDQSLITDLLELKAQLQQAAWLDTYQKVLQKNKNAFQAKKDFIKIFRQTRIQTITWHELSHLLDEKQGQTSQSEVKAFLTELVYGQNPQDVLWQLISGVVDEVEKGNAMDDSIQKLKDVLMAAHNMPWLAQGEQVCFLCFLSKKQVQEIALWAYQKKTEPPFEEGSVSL